MDTKQGVLDILNDLTGEDLSDQMEHRIEVKNEQKKALKDPKNDSQ